ncbi:hypothetical protein [Anaerovorax sp. IOR16]|uniref:hypothetical protein n=1 Tax=Anaerovorax sp. IOR16 TaxID=2773458 RepID=UPI0019D231E1|nr:hypothetical protein [Anaerovorax sp. IOR16]
MILVAGCAHNGIVNILENFYQRKGCFPRLVIGGFHLYNHSCDQTENPKIVKEIGQFLKETNSTYLTCHCTGVDAFHQLKETMGNKLCIYQPVLALVINYKKFRGVTGCIGLKRVL